MSDIYSFFDIPKPFTIKDLNEMVYDFMEVGTPLAPINKYPIYIPSKGRANLNITPSLLQANGLDYTLVVEPQDYDSYCKVHSPERVVRMDKNDMGMWYVRNYMKRFSSERGDKKHWQLDDDIEKFLIRKRNTNKNIEVNPLFCLSVVEHCMDMFTNVAISGIGTNVYAFSKNKAVALNRLAYQCVLVDNSLDIEAAQVGAASDWDYTLRALEAGHCTLAFHHIMQQSAPTFKNSGGCTDIAYVGDKRKLSYESFIKLWPGRFEVKEYPNTKIRWRLRHTRKFLNDYKQTLLLKK
jgi:hypothetical protein